MERIGFRIVIVAALVLSGGSSVAAQDAEGSKDHPLISRYPGSVINEYSQKAFDEYELPLSKLADGKYEKTQHLEGKVTAIYYTTPEGRSALEIYRNYESALKNGGFQALFTCAKTCGDAPPTASTLWTMPSGTTRPTLAISPRS
jgi:OmpA-OmpF porin, OOP family